MPGPRAHGESIGWAGEPPRGFETQGAAGGHRDDKLLSVVIPLFNEEESITELHRRLSEALTGISTLTHEIIYVNDGSTDRTLEQLRTVAEGCEAVTIVELSRNFGHQAAMYAGLWRAHGDAVVLMDGDLQDPPEEIAAMVDLWREGFDVVYAVRKKRKEGWAKRLAYASYYRLLRAASYVPIPVDSGDFSLMDSRVAQILRLLPERNKFLRGLRAWTGFRQVSHVYERESRFAGTSKYSFLRLIRLGLDGLLSYSFVPLRLSYIAGTVVSVSSFLLAIFYIGQRLLGVAAIPQGFTTLAVLILFLGGVQLVFVGVLGEYLGRIYEEVKGRPIYVERAIWKGTAEGSVPHDR
jgi:polyisoprenyl-phosphate glycosyltransferase